MTADDVVISARGLRKVFKLYERPHHRLPEWATLGRVRRHREKVALEDVSFEVRRGECLGVIGGNGSGKSTLLRILAGAQRATSGALSVRGVPYAMIELSTGFQPHLTGEQNLENVAELLGIPRRLLRERREEIIAFSELGENLKRPLREYSSGMQARLAFSMFTHLDPDILLVDEVLSVGDERFQAKSAAKLKGLIQEENRTAIFVSHNLKTVRELCDRVLWLDRGVQRGLGEPMAMVEAYLLSVRRPGAKPGGPGRPGGGGGGAAAPAGAGKGAGVGGGVGAGGAAAPGPGEPSSAASGAGR